ncbi:MAG: hypothetical protein AAGK14_07640 [Verrucomicrobiota bacterium]
MEEAFKQIQLIETLVAAGWIVPDAASGDELAGWCANSPIDEDTLQQIGLTMDSVFARLRHRSYDAHSITVAFADRTVVARLYHGGIFFAWLDSPVNEAVLAWLWPQVEAALAPTGVDLRLA